MNLSKSLRTLPLLLAFATISASAPLLVRHALAQDAPSFSMPSEVPSGTTLKIQASSSMEQFTRNLADSFQTKFTGAKVETATESSDAALKAVLDGKVDLAAIGRPLTPEEKAQGLVAVPIARNKIAMIVGKDNPFAQGSDKGLDINLFARIFRGEITDWQEVGGQPGPIRFVDRPATSDTRQAFGVYPVFESGLPDNKPESTAKEDTTSAVVQELGNDGISFAIADQVINDPNVRVVPMHKVMPDDQRYPFSQPLQYVYRGDANPGVQAFLGYVTASDNKELVEKARLAAIGVTAPTLSAGQPETSGASPNGSPTTTAQAPAAGTAAPALETERGGLPGWWPWLLAIPAGGALIWALKGKGGTDTETPTTMAAAAPVAPPVPDINPAAAAATAVAGTAAAVGAATVGGATVASRSLARRLILTPRNSSDAYAYWEVDDQIKQDLRNQGGDQLKLRLTDVTGLAPGQTPPVIGEFNCQEDDPDLHVPITTPNRDYQAELGYRTTDGRWLSIAKSDPVLVPNTPTASPSAATVGDGGLQGIGAAIAGAGAAAVAGAAGLGALFGDKSETPSEAGDESGNLLGGLFDKATDTAKGVADDATSTIGNLFESGTSTVGDTAADQDSGLFGDLFGKATDAAKGLVEDTTSTVGNLFEGGTAAVGGAMAGAAAVGAAGLGAATQAFNRSETPAAPQAPGSAKDCRIILVPRNSQDAYAYWEVADKYKSVLRQQGGQRLTIRVHDATNIDIDSQAPHGTQEYPVMENQQDLHVKIPATNRDYVVELGYYTSDNRWMRIIRSLHVHVV
jgi:phosphate transport system substrate-binding protein